MDATATSFVDGELVIGDDRRDPWASYKITAIDDLDQESAMSNYVSTQIGGFNKEAGDKNTEDAGITKYTITNAYPNPFNPSTKIKYSIPSEGVVIIKVYDILGNEVKTLVNEKKPVGTYEITWYAESATGELPSGIYFYRIQAGNFSDTKKLILIR